MLLEDYLAVATSFLFDPETFRLSLETCSAADFGNSAELPDKSRTGLRGRREICEPGEEVEISLGLQRG